MRANLRVVAPSAQGSPAADLTPTDRDLVRDRIALRCPRLDQIEPEALDLAADLVADLHREFLGDASQVSAGLRPPKYVGQQLRGDEHPITVEDLALWLVRHPARMRSFVTRAARRCGMETTVERALAVAVEEAVARVAESSGRLVAQATRAAADGVIDDLEDAAIDAAIRDEEKRLAELKAAKAERRRKGGRK